MSYSKIDIEYINNTISKQTVELNETYTLDLDPWNICENLNNFNLKLTKTRSNIVLANNFIHDVLFWCKKNNFILLFPKFKTINFHTNDNKYYIKCDFIKNGEYDKNCVKEGIWGSKTGQHYNIHTINNFYPTTFFINLSYNFMYNDKLMNGTINIPIKYIKLSNFTYDELEKSLSLTSIISQIIPYIFNNIYLKENKN